MKQTDFPAVKKGWVARERIFNQEPKSFQGFAFNLRLAKFQDKKVRQAIAHLLNLRLEMQRNLEVKMLLF
jgi:microcin C transport system substrate-binding protein